VWHGAAAGLAVLQQVRHTDHARRRIGGVQAGDGVVRRCRAFDGHRGDSGAERLREIMTELLDRSTVVVQRYGGTVDKFTGDGIMAVFGAPIALEDHAVRACLAALGVQEQAKALAAEVQDRDTLACGCGWV
jgi:class 3 adenylate cyclase